MPWTLYRYILRELLKLLGLTTAVLVVVMSFAAAIQPMSDGQLSAELLLKFVLFTAPTVLGFALPFAGAFASTLVFIRMAADNEIVACSASGLSYLRILAPVLVLGLVLTGGMLYLSNYVVPGFYRAAERTVQSDAIGVLVAQLNQRNFFEVKDQNLVIYADSAAQFPPQDVPDSPLPMQQLIELKGVAVGETDDAGHIRQDTTAESATLSVFADPNTDDAWVMLRLEGVVRFDPATGGLGRVRELMTRPIRVPSPLSDNPKFFSARELDSHQREPERYDSVRMAMQQLTSALATESLRKALVLLKDRAVLHGSMRGDRYILSTPSIMEDGDVLRLLSDGDEPVRVRFHDDGDPSGPAARIYEATSALVRVRTNALSPEPTIDIDLENVTVLGDDQSPAVGQATLPLRQLAWPEFLPEDLDALRPAELLAEAERDVYADSPAVAASVSTLKRIIERLKINIMGQRHERAAAAVSCSLLLLLGAVLSMKLKGHIPLVVYFWSFLLAIVTLIIINSGMNVPGGTDGSAAVGIAVVWSGNILLVAVLHWAYSKLARN